jgi:aspartyl-tRNA(Asn)/glutamyl-tRNA(Gln) amidotransferase subunit C
MIDRKTIERMAELARLDLTEDDIRAIERDLDRILRFVEELNDLDLSVAPTDDVMVDIALPMRGDEEVDCPADPLLELSPARRDRAYEVPRIIRESEP